MARTLLACLAILLILLVLAGELLLIREHQSIHPLSHIAALGAAICLAATGCYYFRSKKDWDARLTCPRCQRRGEMHLTVFGQPRVSAVGWIVGGFFGALLYGNARKHRFRCEACGQVSELRTTGGWLAAAWLLWLMISVASAVYLQVGD